MINLDSVKQLAAAQPRAIVAPKVEVKASTPAKRQEIVATARKVIDEHREVLMALKNR